MAISTKKAMTLIKALIGEADPVDTIIAGGQQGNRVKIIYSKKTANNEIVEREIRPYEVKNGRVYATDTLHGAGKIHGFIEGRVLSAEILPDTTYKPVWPVKL